MITHAAVTAARSRRRHLPALVVGAVLGAVVLLLICVSILVEAPAPVAPGPGIITAVTPTPPHR